MNHKGALDGFWFPPSGLGFDMGFGPQWPRVALLIAVLLSGVAALQVDAAEEGMTPPIDPIVTDRPTDSASPVLVPTKVLQFELGYKFTRQDTVSNRTDAQVFPDLLARYGISRKVELRLTASGWTFRDTDAENQDGFTDVSLGTKIALADARGKRPQMSLLADVNLPVGDPGFTDDYFIPKVLFLATHGLTDRLGLTYNLGPSLVTRKKNNKTRTDVTLHYAVALSGEVAGAVSLFGEVYGAFVYGDGLPDRHSVQAGATVLLSRNVQFDVRAGLGLVDDVPDWLAGVGLAFRLPLRGVRK